MLFCGTRWERSGESRSSVGQSTTLIMWGSAVQLRSGLRKPGARERFGGTEGRRPRGGSPRQRRPGEYNDKAGEQRKRARRVRERVPDTRKTRRAHGGCLWLSEARKDVTSCEKPRGGANGPGSAGVRMGEPARLKAGHRPEGRGERREPKHPSSGRRREQE